MAEELVGIGEIDRKYDVLQKLGEGGMGAVYKVRHRHLDEFRVIKTIRAQLNENADLQGRFLHEAKFATQLRHEGIAQTYDFGVGEEGKAYIVMEHVEGTDLSHLLRSDEAPTQAEILDIADQVLEVLGYLHEKRLVHRDVSPDNIMARRDKDGRFHVKLIDLGIAKNLEASQQYTRTGVFVGKLKYASPEQLGSSEGGTVSPESDLYSFGLVLYELLTGEFPILGDSEATIIAGHLFHPPRGFEDTDPENRVGPELREVVIKSLAKTAADRYRTADEFRRALAAVQGEATTVARPRSAAAAAPAWTEEETRVTPPLPETERRAPPTEAGGAGGLVGRLVGLYGKPAIAAGAALLVVALLAALWATGVLGGGATGGVATTGELPDRGAPPPLPAGIDFGSYRALVIGNDRYQQLPRLESAVADATAVADLLTRTYGFDVELVTNATRREIITALTEVTASLTASDNLLVYYAGHGWLDESNQSGYWQPIDAEPDSTANWISTKHEVAAVLSRVPAKHVLVVADSCFSGSLTEDVAPAPPPRGRGGPDPDRLRDLVSRRSRLALTSGGLAPVLDQGDGEHSVFSKALLEALARGERPQPVSLIYSQIREQVQSGAARFGVEQDPRLAPIAQAGDEGGEFFFVPARAAG